MSVRILKLINLKEGDKFTPDGALGKHYINVIKIKEDSAIVQEYKSFDFYEIKDGALYNAGRILSGDVEKQERISMHSRWVQKQIEVLQKEIDDIDKEYDIRLNEDRFFGSVAELELRVKQNKLEAQIIAVKELDYPVFKPKAVLIKDIEESYQQ